MRGSFPSGSPYVRGPCRFVDVVGIGTIFVSLVFFDTSGDVFSDLLEGRPYSCHVTSFRLGLGATFCMMLNESSNKLDSLHLLDALRPRRLRRTNSSTVAVMSLSSPITYGSGVAFSGVIGVYFLLLRHLLLLYLFSLNF
jgi:hypothetical protein